MLIIAGTAPDLDYLSYFGGPAAFLHFHHTLLHSLPGALLLALITATIFLVIDRNWLRKSSNFSRLESPSQRRDTILSPLRFLPALTVCAFGIAAHIALDLIGEVGVRLSWPLRDIWTAYDLIANFDPWILLILALGIALPQLVRLVREEIGERKRGTQGQGLAIIFLLLLLAYLGARAELHRRATVLLNSREYHGLPPGATSAFPGALLPFQWRGLVSTASTIEETEISLSPGLQFDPDRTLTHYKPQPSLVLDVAQNTETAKTFLAYARFPIATMEPVQLGYRFTLRDLRFPLHDQSPYNIVAIVELSPGLTVTSQELRYARR